MWYCNFDDDKNEDCTQINEEKKMDEMYETKEKCMENSCSFKKLIYFFEKCNLEKCKRIIEEKRISSEELKKFISEFLFTPYKECKDLKFVDFVISSAVVFYDIELSFILERFLLIASVNEEKKEDIYPSIFTHIVEEYVYKRNSEDFSNDWRRIMTENSINAKNIVPILSFNPNSSRSDSVKQTYLLNGLKYFAVPFRLFFDYTLKTSDTTFTALEIMKNLKRIIKNSEPTNPEEKNFKYSSKIASALNMNTKYLNRTLYEIRKE